MPQNDKVADSQSQVLQPTAMTAQQFAQVQRAIANLQGSTNFFMQPANGVPTSAQPIGVVYLRRDAPDAAHLVYVSMGGGTWVPLGTGTGTVTSVNAGIGISITGTAAAPVVNVIAQNGSGTLLSGFHVEVGTASFAAASAVTVTLTGASQFTSGTSYAVFVDYGTLAAPPTSGGGATVLLVVDSKAAGSFKIEGRLAATNALQTFTATIPWVAAGF
jgi:hypothetical protein